MVNIPFDVNSDILRERFFAKLYTECIGSLKEDTAPLWGKMSAQEMVEHLSRVFQCSTGKIEVACHTPENLLERTKRFLYDNRPTPHDFVNPLLGENVPPLTNSSYNEAVGSLLRELDYFAVHFKENPDAVHIHPLFGPLDAEQWQRSHFKHSYHHLMQFGLINQVDS